MREKYLIMFKKIFQYFKKTEEDNTKECLAKICLYIPNEESKPVIDITVDQYNTQCVSALAKIVHNIQNQSCVIEIIKIITDHMKNSGEAESLVTFLVQLGHESQNYEWLNIQNETSQPQEEPCIKPSDMLK